MPCVFDYSWKNNNVSNSYNWEKKREMSKWSYYEWSQLAGVIDVLTDLSYLFSFITNFPTGSWDNMALREQSPQQDTVLRALTHSCISPAAALGGSGQCAQQFAKAQSREAACLTRQLGGPMWSQLSGSRPRTLNEYTYILPLSRLKRLLP